jgi:predicted nucleic acid-binding protein
VTSDPVYLLDTNVFIEAARRYYAFDLAPRFWESLLQHSENGRVLSVDRVRQELERGNDELARWVKGHFRQAFASTDEAGVIQAFGEIMNWVQAQGQFTGAAKAEFANNADGWLVAYARVNRCVVVTHEVMAPDARRKVPIPNICHAFGVQNGDTFEMLRTLGVRFT